jgi:Flp pilus assembly protein TadB
MVMVSDNTKMLLFASWAIVVCLAAIAIGVTSLPYWMVVACVALVPPFVVRRFWHDPEQTISESIDNARR